MWCPQVKKRLTALLAGECTYSEEIKIKRHLDACPRCRREMEELKAVDGLLDCLGPVEAPTDLFQGIMGAVEKMAPAGPQALPTADRARTEPAKPAKSLIFKDVSIAAAAALAAFWLGTGFLAPLSSAAGNKISGAMTSYVQYTGAAVSRANSSISYINEDFLDSVKGLDFKNIRQGSDYR